jgi:signal peptidase II
MKAQKLVRVLIILLIVVTNVGCDQITKHIVRNQVEYHEQIPLIQQHLTLTKIENTGAFLSLGESLSTPLKFVLLSLLPILALIGGLYYLFTHSQLSKIRVVALSFVIGGGIGNMYDRVSYGSVTDFLHIQLGIFQTGIFNMADVSIMIGMFFLLVDSYFNRPESELEA